MAIKIAIRHAMAGRVRLWVGDLCRDRLLAEAFLVWLRAQDGVRKARINFSCSSLVVEYDIGQDQNLKLLVGRLSAMTHDELFALTSHVLPATKSEAKPSANVMRERAPRPLHPLTLPTVSLGAALIGGPMLAALNIPLMLWNAYPISLRAYSVWRRERRLNVDFLDTLAVGASLIQNHQVAGSLVTWLIKLGDWIRDLTAAGNKRAVRDLLEFRDKTAWIMVEGQVVSIASQALKVGDHVVVHPGEMIAVDGEIIDGSALIDQKTITGEGLPVMRAVGDKVFAATVLREGQLVVRAENVGENTTAGQIVRLIDSAPVGDTRMQNHAERLADRLVAPTLGLATAASLLSRDFDRFLSLVIVDYGTGIRVAAPTAMLSSMTAAARAGVIVKSGRHMERLAEADTIVFDKTGTLTRGTPEIVEIVTYQKHINAATAAGLAAAAESRLQHPVADALRRKAEELGAVLKPCPDARFAVGLGVEGVVGDHVVHVGNARFMAESGIGVVKSAKDRARFDELGYSCLYVAVDGKLAALTPFADQPRPESRAIIRRLHRLGVKNTIMLTGDNSVVARAVGSQLGLTRQYADRLPADKAEVIQSLQKEGRVVAMVGDGINDSPALSFADVGVAMKHGAEVTHESADVVLMEDSLWKLVEAIEISRNALGLIRQNYGIVIALNTLALGLALPGGLISPATTALLSNGSAILASANAMRPLMFRK